MAQGRGWKRQPLHSDFLQTGNGDWSCSRLFEVRPAYFIHGVVHNVLIKVCVASIFMPHRVLKTLGEVTTLHDFAVPVVRPFPEQLSG